MGPVQHIGRALAGAVRRGNEDHVHRRTARGHGRECADRTGPGRKREEHTRDQHPQPSRHSHVRPPEVGARRRLFPVDPSASIATGSPRMSPRVSRLMARSGHEKATGSEAHPHPRVELAAARGPPLRASGFSGRGRPGERRNVDPCKVFGEPATKAHGSSPRIRRRGPLVGAGPPRAATRGPAAAAIIMRARAPASPIDNRPYPRPAADRWSPSIT